MERIRWRLRYEKALVIEPIGLSGGMSSGSMKLSRISGGAVIGDSAGELVAGFTKSFGNGDVVLAELLAILEGVRLCKHLDIDNVSIETDSKEAFHAITGSGSFNWQHTYLIRNIISNTW